MSCAKCYLKSNVVIEPLFERWYAWAHLISPATAALNVTGRHLKIMNSYIQAHKIHAEAVKNPKMLGGPFMDYPENKVGEIRKLRDETLQNQQEQIKFAEAVKSLNDLLQTNASGYSLEQLYELIPEELRGYVELVYDLNNNAAFRLYEQLLYKSKFYNTGSQSIAVWLTENDERPFVLSTPRLNSENVLHLNIPFNDELIDELADMKRRPKCPALIKQKLQLRSDQEALFDSFLTEVVPNSYKKYEGRKAKMRYFGHACVLIETRYTSILVDPVISYYGYQSDVARFTEADLPDEIDYVLITHNHQDHILLETLLALRSRIKNIIVPRSSGGALQDPNLRLMFRNLGFKNIIELEEMETLQFQDCSITGVPFIGEHCDLDIKSKICHYVKTGKVSMLFAADSCNIEPKLYEHVHRQLGDVDVLFLGMECDGAPLTWLYGPLLFNDLERSKDESRRLAGSNYSRAKDFVSTYNPKEVYVYAMGQEPWLQFISSIKYTDESNPIVASNKLIANCLENGIYAERLFGEKELLYDIE